MHGSIHQQYRGLIMNISKDLHQLEGILYLGTNFFSFSCITLVIFTDIRL
jgi:hypothetical protein